MNTRVVKFEDGRVPSVGDTIEIDGQFYYHTGARRFSTQVVPASVTTYDSCQSAVLATGGTLESPAYPVQDYCQDTDIDVELDRMYINPSDTISTGDKVFFNGRGFVKTGNTGTATHVLTAMPVVVDYDATCVLPPSGESTEESGGVSAPGYAFTDTNFKTACGEWCADATAAEATYGHITTWDTSAVTDMSNAFRDCTSITTLDLSNWNTSNVISMGGTFRTCTNLTQLNLTGWDFENVTSMSMMFMSCSNLTTITTTSWNTTKCETFWRMFWNCYALENLNISSLQTETANQNATIGATLVGYTRTDVFDDMFWGCTVLTDPGDFSGWCVSLVPMFNSSNPTNRGPHGFSKDAGFTTYPNWGAPC